MRAMELLGHKEKIHSIEKEVLAGTGSRSYLFSGPEAIGKFQAALFLAKRLVGEPEFEASVEAPYPADVLVLAPSTTTKDEKTKTKGIAVEEVRNAIQFLTRYPSKGKYRILIIRDTHVLAPAAQNMILKTLEEPPASAIIILVTHEPGALLPTVRSRVNEKMFLPLSPAEMQERYSDAWLEENNIPPFFRNFGRPGILETAALHPEQFQQKKTLLTGLYKITQLNAKQRLDLAEELSKDVPQAVTLLEWWLHGLRNQAKNQGKREQQISFYNFLEGILAVIENLKTTQGNARLLLEQLFFQIR